MERKIGKPLVAALGLVAILAGIGITTISTQDQEKDVYEIDAMLENRLDNVSKEDIQELVQAIKQMKQDNDDLAQRSSLLDQEVTKLRAQLQEMAGDKVAEVSKAEDSDKIIDSKEQLEQQMEQMQAKTEAQNELIEQSHLAEDSDPGWAGAMQTSLDEMLRDEQLQGVQLSAIDCRTTLCRVNLHADNTKSAETSIRMLGHAELGAGQGFFRIDEIDGGGGEITMYVAKEGHSLPGN